MTNQETLARPSLAGFPPQREIRSHKASPGLHLARPAPALSASSVGTIAEMVRRGPSPVFARKLDVKVGDPVPAFRLENTDGETRDSASFAGTPFVLLLARVMGPEMYCPYSAVGMVELRDETFEKFADAGVELVIVLPTTIDQAQRVVDDWQLPYALYADPACALFDAFDVGYLGPPLHAWTVVGADGRMSYVFRTIEYDMVPVPIPTIEELLDFAAGGPVPVGKAI
jgi:peroxiredoxin